MFLSRTLMITLLTVIIFVSLLYLLRPINDFDFFWHLKTGEIILQNKSLPAIDPFSFTTPATLTSRQHFILTSYWASQAIYSLIYTAAGMNGIVLLRGFMAGLIIIMLLCLRKGDRIVTLGLGLLSLVIFFELYPLERPQVFSFLFFGLLIHLLNRIKTARIHEDQQGRYSRFTDFAGLVLPLCLLMIVWSNMHGGHLIGQATIVFYMTVEGFKFAHRSLRPIGRKTYLLLIAAGIAGLSFSLINPNSYHALGELMSMPSYMKDYNIEFQSTLAIFRVYDNYTMAFFWVVLLLAGAGILTNISKADITEVLLLAGTGYFAFMQMRYIAFFLVAALPVTAINLSLRRFQPLIRAGVIIAAMTAVLFFTRDELPSLKNFSSLGKSSSANWVNEYSFPIRAVDFIQANHLEGNMFNRQSWGGYIMWRLGPEEKVFFDGRQLNEGIYAQATLVEIAYAEDIAGVPFWKSTLDAYGVKYVIIPFFQPHGAVLPLVPALINDPDWTPVFFYMNSVIFVKNSPENYPVLSTNSIPKDYFVDDLINICNNLIHDYPSIIYPYIAKGDLFAIKNKPKEARETYEQALSLSPHNITARERLRALSRK